MKNPIAPSVADAGEGDLGLGNEPLVPDLLSAIPDPVIISDANGRILFVNPAVQKIFGYTPKQLIGQKVEVLVPQKARTRHAALRAAYAAEPKFRSMGDGMDLRAVRADGTEFPVAISLGFTEWQGRQIVIATVQDLTERKKRADRMKNQFVATVSHELRTPVTSIMGSLALVTSGAAGALPDRAALLLKTASASCRRLVRLINDILDLEKAESGKMVFDLEPVDVRTLIKQEIEANQSFAEQYGVRLRLDRASVHAMVHADPDRLSQVVTNLLSNAIKFSPRGAEVAVTIEKLDANVRISVRDHGPGIPDELKDHIFEKFVQVDADGHHNRGTGLGLSIVKQIVERLGGEVGFERAPGGGTNFYVTLPQWEQDTQTAKGQQMAVDGR